MHWKSRQTCYPALTTQLAPPKMITGHHSATTKSMIHMIHPAILALASATPPAMRVVAVILATDLQCGIRRI